MTPITNASAGVAKQSMPYNCTPRQLLVAILILVLHAFHNIGLCSIGMSSAQTNILLDWHIYYVSILFSQGVILAAWVVDGSGTLASRYFCATVVSLLLGIACLLGIVSNRSDLGIDEVIVIFLPGLEMSLTALIVRFLRALSSSTRRSIFVIPRFTLANVMSAMGLCALLAAIIAGLIRSGIIRGSFEAEQMIAAITVPLVGMFHAGPAFISCGVVAGRRDRQAGVKLLVLTFLQAIVAYFVVGFVIRSTTVEELLLVYVVIVVAHVSAIVTAIPFRFANCNRAPAIAIAPSESER